MQVSAIDQIVHSLPIHARAYGARAKTSNESMNIMPDVSECSGTEDKSTQQNLPIEDCKDDQAVHKRTLTAPAGLTQVLEKLFQKGVEHPDVKGLTIAPKRVQSSIDRYMTKAAAVMPSASPAPDTPSVDITA